MRLKKIIGISILATVLLGAGGLIYMATRKKAPDTTSIATVERRTVKNDVELSGELEAETSATFGFESTGVIKNSPVKVGDAVSTGQILATLDSQTVALEAAKATADRANSADTAAVTLDSARSALKSTQTQNSTTLEAARQKVRDAKKEYDQSKEVWEQTVRESGDDSSITGARYSAVLTAQSLYHTAQQALTTTEKTALTAQDAAQAKVDSAEAAYSAASQASLTTKGVSSLGALEQIAKIRLSKTVIRAP